MTSGLHLQQYGRSYRPALWHLERQDPHDAFDGWRWSFTPWVAADSDPCDEWAVAAFDPWNAARFVTGTGMAFIRGFEIYYIAIDEFERGPSLRSYADRLRGTFEVSGEITAYFSDTDAIDRLLELKPLASDEPKPYDYQRHNKTRKRQP